MRRAIAASLLGTVLALFLAPGAAAQGCVMCYTSAAGQDPAAAQKLDLAILALLIPVLLLFVSVLGWAIHRRNAEAPDSQVLASEVPAPEVPASRMDDSVALLADGPSPRGRSVVRLHLELPTSPGD